MDPGILLGSLAALLFGIAAILIAYRLDKAYRHPFLGDYVMLLVLSAAWGFALWTVPAFLSAGGPAVGRPAGLARLPLVSKWFGFPFHLLQLYFLVLALSGLLERPVSRTFRRAFLAVSAVVLTVLLSALLNMLRGGDRTVFTVLHDATTWAYLTMQALILGWGGWRAGWVADPTRQRTARWFSLLYLGGFAAYYGLTTWVTRSTTICAWIFAAYHWPPLVVLALGLRQGFAAASATASPKALSAWLDRFGLTDRERDIVTRLIDGQSNRRMADELFLSHQTVKNYVSRIYRKLDVSSRVELIVALRKADESAARGMERTGSRSDPPPAMLRTDAEGVAERNHIC